jgi:hypothetical protein
VIRASGYNVQVLADAIDLALSFPSAIGLWWVARARDEETPRKDVKDRLAEIAVKVKPKHVAGAAAVAGALVTTVVVRKRRARG